MLSHWETIWICVAFTLFAMMLDFVLADRLKKRSSTQKPARENRQTSMEYKQLEE